MALTTSKKPSTKKTAAVSLTRVQGAKKPVKTAAGTKKTTAKAAPKKAAKAPFSILRLTDTAIPEDREQKNHRRPLIKIPKY
jgi:hypothetical protein